MIKQMLKKVVVTDGGDSGLSLGQTLSINSVNERNAALLDEDKAPIQYGPILLGISKSAVETDSFLSAASFQETTRVLTDAAVRGKVDSLSGLKENVIIGKLIPAGTGRPEYKRETTDRIVAKAEWMKAERRRKAEELLEATETRLPDEVIRSDADKEVHAEEEESAE